MNKRWFRGAVIALIPWAALALSVPGHTVASEAPSLALSQHQALAQALGEFHERRYAAAYGRFARLADEGHVLSACIALVMVRDGPLLFQSDWSATPEQLRRWGALTIQAASVAPWLPPGDD